MMSISLRIVIGIVVGALLAVAGIILPLTAEAGTFGIETFETQLFPDSVGIPASSSIQAGSHPYSMTTTIVFDHENRELDSEYPVVPYGDPRRIEVNLPPGLVANPSATQTRCPEAELQVTGECPNSSVVGVDTYEFGLRDLGSNGGKGEPTPVYNMETPPGLPAELGFKVVFEGITVHIIGKIRTGADYGLSAYVPEANQQVAFWTNTITLWGDPSAQSHDSERGPCVKTHGDCLVDRVSRPFLTAPTSCGGTLTASVSANSWQEPSNFAERAFTMRNQEGDPLTVTGCEKLNFAPRLSVQPTSHAAASPTGLDVELTVPQEEAVEGLAEANLKEAVVTLPAGMSVSTAAADGLGACKDTPEPAHDGEPERPGGEIELLSSLPVTCPANSKIGTVEVETPLLEQPIEGSVYLAQQATSPFPASSNPFGSLLAIYIVLEGKGVVIKLPGEVRLDPTTGQLTTVFGEDPATTRSTGTPQFLPQVPFSRLKLDFFSGSRAALVTPRTCGTYSATSSLTPWSAPDSGPPATPSSSFTIDERCGEERFAPTFLAGTENNQAGEFSPLTVLTTLPESGGPEQRLNRIQVVTPPGLLGRVSAVQLCAEAEAAVGKCDQSSMIGHVAAGVGAGPDQLYVSGEVFLTGPYKGAPFGLSIVVPAVAGPFDLGLVNVRATVNVDPHTAALTVTSDPLPPVLDGIPLQVRTVHVDIDQEHFTLNPTSCAAMSIDGTATSTSGASASLHSRFQAANCVTLGFGPKFTVTASGVTSRVNGTSLDVKLVVPPSPQTNIAEVKVELPKQLSARLKTLQKACPAAVFEADPASCPPGSIVGVVQASTPILPVVLTGPAYFVSHGGEAFPDLDVILQGDNVRVDLVGSTFISKANITSSTFRTLPDVPVSSFELYLPAGPNSALASVGNLCKISLRMPTTFVGYSGATIHQRTPVAVSGCPKVKHAKKNKKARKARNARRHRRGGSR